MVSNGSRRSKSLSRKAETKRRISIVVEQWLEQTKFNSSANRINELKCFLNFYNSLKTHKAIKNLTPMEKLIEYFYPDEFQTTLGIITNKNMVIRLIIV